MRKLNLQFFADEDIDVSTGVEESEAAEPTEVEGTDVDASSDETSDAEEITEAEVETTEPSVDVNAIAAAARRKAEAEAREAQARRDAEAVRRFGHLKNPITGEPIRSENDYWKALDAQEQLKREQTLREKGVDPQLINDLVTQNPLVKQASEYLATAQQKEADELINKDVATLAQMDSSIKSFEDIPVNVVQTAIDRGLNLVEAYKLENYGKVSSQKEEAIRQGAINQARNKAHLNPINGVATKDNSVEIPQNLRAMWEEAFPNKTWAERKALYNEQLQ